MTAPRQALGAAPLAGHENAPSQPGAGPSTPPAARLRAARSALELAWREVELAAHDAQTTTPKAFWNALRTAELEIVALEGRL